MHEREKLDEARYFLSRMVATADQSTAFRYESSAFLSASRSVLQYANRESIPKTGGQEWYDGWVSDNKRLQFFRNKRNFIIHEEPVIPTTSVNVATSDVARLSKSVFVEVRDSEGRVVKKVRHSPESPPSHAEQPPQITYSHSFADWTGPEDILALCPTYLADIESMVNDGIAKGFLTGAA